MKSLSRVAIDRINVAKSAKYNDRYLDEAGNIWNGSNFGTLVVFATTEQISSRTNPLTLEERLKALENAASAIAGTAITKLTGDVTATGPGSVVATLSSTGVSAGTYGDASNYSVFTVDVKGRLTAASQLALPTSLPPSGSAGGDLSGSYPNPGVVWSNGYTTYDARYVLQTRTLTAGTGLSGGGDLSANRSFTITNTGVTAASYGSATSVGTFTVNAQGQLTAAANVTISGTSPGGSASGDLSGSYPGPSVVWVNGYTTYDARYPLLNGSGATGTWGISITGNSATVTNGVYTTGSYANPSWISSLAWSKITGTPTTLGGYGITDAVSTSRTLTINGTAQDLSANRTWSVGTVTSVDISVPSILSVSGNPISTSGTLALSLATQTAGTVFAGPAGAGPAAAPTFRALTTGDLPSGTVTGSGATNTLAYWSSASVLTKDSNTLMNGSSYLFGYSTLIGSEFSAFRKDQNATTRVAVINGTSGTAALSQLLITASSTFSSGMSFNAISAGFTSTGITVASTGVITANMTGGLNIGTTAATQVSFWTNNTEKVRVNSTGEVGIGMTAVNILDITQTQNAASIFKITNANAGTSSQVQIIASNGTYSSFVQILGTGFSTSGLNQANLTKFNSTSPVGTLFQNNVASTTFWWSIGGVAANNEVMQLTATGLGILTLAAPNVALDINGGVAIRPVTPAQITANQNDYNFGSAANNAYTAARLSSDASRNITGISAPFTGKLLILPNVGSFNIVFKHQDASSTAANRFLFSTGGDITVAPNGTLTLWYDLTTARWRDIAVR